MVTRKKGEFEVLAAVVFALIVILVLFAILSTVFPSLSSLAMGLMLVLFTIIPLVLVYVILSKVAPGFIDCIQVKLNEKL